MSRSSRTKTRTVGSRRGLTLVALVALGGLWTAAPASAATSVTARWESALANRQAAPATWLAMGDSVVEGQGASTLAKRWINQALGLVRQADPTTGAPGGVGYLAGWDYLYGPDSSWTPYAGRSGTVSNVSAPTSFGELTARLSRGGSQTYSITGTSADIAYDFVSGGGTLSYQLDGGQARTLSTSGAARPDAKIHVAFPATGTHSLRIAAASGTVYLEGVTAYNGDEAKGIRLVADAHAGFDSASYLADRANLNKLTAAAAPDLVTIDWGANDYLNATHTPAQLTANLQSEIANLRGLLVTKQPSIAVVLPYSFGTARNALGYAWADYGAAIRAVTAADPSVGLMDLSAMSTTGGNISANDGIHPSDQGQAVLAGLAATYLTTSH